MSSQIHRDPTFSNYTADQAHQYAQHRSGYPPELINYILCHHEQTGGQLNTVLDVGCGAGNSTRDLAHYFDHAVGIDPSKEMTSTARSIGGSCKSGRAIQYSTGDAEACEGVASSSIDLLTAALSAHWFDMEQFWPTAARVLKPNGTVAFFSIDRKFCPPSMAQAGEVQQVIVELESETLRPFLLPGNLEVMNGYKGLQMPWMLDNPCSAFDQKSFVRKVWNEDGKADPEGNYMSGERVQTLEEMKGDLGTSSAVTRWRKAHPRLAHTDEDCVLSAIEKIVDILGHETVNISTAGPTVLLMLKRL